MEEVFDRFKYPCASPHLRCKVSCQGGLNLGPALLLHPCFIKVSLMIEKNRPTHSLVAKLHQCSPLAVLQFCATNKECCKWGYGHSRYTNGKPNLALTSLPPRKTRQHGGENLFRRETAGHKDKDHLWIKLGAEAKKELFCPVMAFEWWYLSMNDLCSQFSCRLTTATAVMERAWSPVTWT